MQLMKLKSFVKWGASVALGATAALFGFSQPAVELKVGDTAPDFSLVGSDGATHTLASFRNKSTVVVAWFPKAFTGG
jgi:peroxiredoxin Q/BCP